MIKNKLVILFLLSVLSCTEPFEFEVEQTSLIVVDGKVSTQAGQSFVSLNALDKDGTATAIADHEVSILNLDGDRFLFRFNGDSNKYFPEQANFLGEIGQSYRLEIHTNDDEMIFNSSYEVIAPPYAFDIVTMDTTQKYLTALNIVQERGGVAAVAVIPPPNKEVYSKLTFQYTYLNIVTEELETVYIDDYVLHGCSNEQECGQATSIAVGLRLNLPWEFYSRDGACPPEPNRSISCELNPCCTLLQSWKTDFEIVQETLSPEAFQYFENIKRLTNNDGLIFDTYPFQLKGNVVCDGCANAVVGIFRAVAESSATIEVII